MENEYKVFPSPGLVIGFQYKGQLAVLKNNSENKLNSAGITGITDGYKIFKNSADIGTVLVYFTEIGFCNNRQPSDKNCRTIFFVTTQRHSSRQIDY